MVKDSEEADTASGTVDSRETSHLRFRTLDNENCQWPFMEIHRLRQLKKHELDYPTHDLRLAVVIFILKPRGTTCVKLLIESLPIIREWKCECITRDLIFKLPPTIHRHDGSLHGALVSIVSEKDPRFTSREIGMSIYLWQSSSTTTVIDMLPYEALYGKQCRTSLCWNAMGERKVLGPEIIQTTIDKVNTIWVRLKAAQNKQKSYADLHRKDLDFKVGDRVFQKLFPWKGIVRFGKRGKRNPRYIGLYEIIERIGPVAYSLDLPKELSRVHDVFHISMLYKYISDPSHVLETPEFELRDDLSYEEQPMQILSREEKKLCNKTIPLVKVLSRNHLVKKAT
ncbi:uncharacterized protein LOC132800034 [Ziziphus jujuba]|uniref:Uncharacterized protein LOC132800034 n=1 Tax=Ziziphus jujuba TaxID=326968 RepID=A0ABM3ZWQ6_ZIZJJ|nr:uncharacterized protein LOC132800034 [Ziziphus jujuba]